jgi:NADP-dependent alcohol dehydrogenase
MNNFTFYNPVKIIFGKGQIAQLSKQIPANARILLTYGGGVYSKTESTIR